VYVIGLGARIPEHVQRRVLEGNLLIREWRTHV